MENDCTFEFWPFCGVQPSNLGWTPCDPFYCSSIDTQRHAVTEKTTRKQRENNQNSTGKQGGPSQQPTGIIGGQGSPNAHTALTLMTPVTRSCGSWQQHLPRPVVDATPVATAKPVLATPSTQRRQLLSSAYPSSQRHYPLAGGGATYLRENTQSGLLQSFLAALVSPVVAS